MMTNLMVITNRISSAPIYRTWYEHRAIYNNTNDTHTHTHLGIRCTHLISLCSQSHTASQYMCVDLKTLQTLWLASWNIWGLRSVIYWADPKPRTSHHLPPGGETEGKCLLVFFEKTRVGHHQSDKHWSCFKGNTTEIPERNGWSAYGLSSAHKYHLD